MGKNENDIKQPLSSHVYGNIMYWLAIISAVICTIAPVIIVAFPERNLLNPHFLYSAIWDGAEPELIWQTAGGGFPGGHFWIDYMTYGDGIIQFGIVLGCLCAAVALLATAVAYIKQKPRNYGWAALSATICVLIILAAVLS